MKVRITARLTNCTWVELWSITIDEFKTILWKANNINPTEISNAEKTKKYNDKAKTLESSKWRAKQVAKPYKEIHSNSAESKYCSVVFGLESKPYKIKKKNAQIKFNSPIFNKLHMRSLIFNDIVKFWKD